MTTTEKRKISPSEDARIQRNRTAIKKNIDLSSGDLMDVLLEAGFDVDDMEEIMNVSNRRERIDLLLKRLRYREDGFRIFVVALRKSGSGFLADLLLSDVDELSKSTQTSPTLERRNNHHHLEETSNCSSASNETVQSADVVDGPKLNTAKTSKDPTTPKDTPQTTFYLHSADDSQKSNEDVLSESASVLMHTEDMNQKSVNEYVSPIYENEIGEYCRDVGTSVESEYDDAISLPQSYEQLQLENIEEEKTTYDYATCLQDKNLPLQNPARLHGFSGSKLASSLPEEFSTLFEESGWYAGITEKNISVAVDQAQSQQGSYIIWYSHKYETIVVTVIDKDSKKGRIHFKMLRTHDDISTLYHFDGRVHCRTPIEILNAVKKKGLLIRAENVSNYYK